MKLVGVIVSILLLVAGSAAFAQSTSASLSGQVLDPSGAVVPGTAIVATDIKTGVNTRTAANAEGLYSFPALQAGVYRLSAERQGFRQSVVNNILLEVSARVAVDIRLEVGQAAEVVEVVADSSSPLSYVNSSVSNTVGERKVLDLPVSSRNVLNLTTTAAGTNGGNFNGSRIGNLNIQIDGINVQDARINMGVSSTIFASVDRVSEFRVITQPIDAEFGRGSGQVQLITRSGSNDFHGSVFAFHRNTALNANTWFNNQAGIDTNTGSMVSPREQLIRNQYGTRIGGPVIKNKTFFHFLWEGQKVRRSDTVTATVWTPDMRKGLYRFYPGVQNGNANASVPTVDASGNPLPPAPGATLSSVNIFAYDPQRSGFDSTGLVQKYISAMPMPNYFRTGDGLNTAGYRWNRPYKFDENNFNIKVDHELASKHRLSVSVSTEGSTELNNFMPAPYPGLGEDNIEQKDRLYQGTLTSMLSPTTVNEFRAGALRPLFRFYSPWELNPGIMPVNGSTPFGVDFGTISDPINLSNDPQGRISPNYQFFNKTSMIRGSHNIKFGGQVWFVSTNGFNSFSVLPRAVIGAGGVPVSGISTIPGIGANQTGAQNILNDLNGSVANYSQALNSPGGSNPVFLPGEVKQRVWRDREFAFFFQDDWKVSKKLTVNFGLRYEYYGVPNEKHGKAASVVGGTAGIFGISGTNWDALFKPGAAKGAMSMVNLVGPASPNPSIPMYNNDWNNFAPAIGISYAPSMFGENKTVIRAGYSAAYERLSLRMVDVASGDQPGLRQVADYRSASKLDLSNGKLPLAPVGAPLALIPYTDRTQTLRVYDSNLRVPFIHNFNVSIQRQLPKSATLSVSYVGSKGTRLLRGADVNEHNIFETGILEAFNVTRAGGNAALFDKMLMGLNVPGRGVVNGTTLTGSQVFRDVNTTTQGYLASGSVGTMASYLNSTNYLTNVNGGLLRNGGLAENYILANPQFASARLFSNLSNSTYHSLQVEYLQRMRSLMVQWNYTFSKGLGDEDGNAQEQNDSFRTQRNRSLDKRLLDLSAQHIMRSNAIYDLPIGPGQKWASGDSWVKHLIGGWQVGGIFNIFSGDPLAISALGSTTFNAWNDNTPVAHGKLDPHLGQVMRTGNGVVYFNGYTQALDPIIQSYGTANVKSRSTLRAISDPNGNLLFSNPAPGVLGPLNQRALFGPMSFRFDANIIKTVRLTEQVNMQFNAIFENATNSPQFGNPNLDINDTNFGRITSAGGNRVIVVGARVNF